MRGKTENFFAGKFENKIMTKKKSAPQNPLLISAIRKKAVLKFIYNRQVRIVEPQTYGVSTTGKEVLRAHQISGDSRTGNAHRAKLFDVSKMEKLEKTNEKFHAALDFHNPDDSAMIKIFATLAKL
jgi:hypothetical protein